MTLETVVNRGFGLWLTDGDFLLLWENMEGCCGQGCEWFARKSKWCCGPQWMEEMIGATRISSATLHLFRVWYCLIFRLRTTVCLICWLKSRRVYIVFRDVCVNNWRAPWKNRIYWYISFFRPSLNRVLFPMFCLLVEGESQILVF